MNGKDKFLIDTNILIYYFDGKFSELQKHFLIELLKNSFNISVITKIEFLGFKEYFENPKFEIAKNFLSKSNIIPLNDEIVETIVEFRQKYNLKLGDSIIAATSYNFNLTLVTRNVNDFDKIKEIKVFNPFEIV